MAFSSYQLERLIRRLRRWIAGPFPGRGHVPDPVRTTSGEGHGAAMDSRLQGGVREEATDEAFSSRRAGAGHPAASCSVFAGAPRADNFSLRIANRGCWMEVPLARRLRIDLQFVGSNP